jgi:hypothetical protein
MASGIYGTYPDKANNKEIDLLSDTIKVALCTNSYVPNQDTHDYFNDITNEVPATGGYTAGGATLASKTYTYNSGTNTWTFDAADVTWSAATITNARYAIIYDATPGTAATNPLIAYIDFGSDKSSSGGDFVIQWNASGIFTDVVAAAA